MLRVLWVSWLALVFGFYALGVLALRREHSFFALLLMALPSVLFGGATGLVLWWCEHLARPADGSRLRTLRRLVTWGAALFLAWLLPTFAFLVFRGPFTAAFWPFQGLLVLAGDPAVPPKLDWPSRDRWRAIQYERDEARALRELDALIADHPEYYNLYQGRAAWHRQRGDLERALADLERGLEVRRSGGYYLPYDSDMPSSIERDRAQVDEVRRQIEEVEPPRER